MNIKRTVDAFLRRFSLKRSRYALSKLGVEGEANAGLPGTREKAKMPNLYECILLAIAVVNVAMTVAFYVTVLGLIKSLFGHR